MIQLNRFWDVGIALLLLFPVAGRSAQEGKLDHYSEAREGVVQSIDDLNRCLEAAGKGPGRTKGVSDRSEAQRLLVQAQKAAQTGHERESIGLVKQAAQVVRRALAQCRRSSLPVEGAGPPREVEPGPRNLRKVKDEIGRLRELLVRCSEETGGGARSKDVERTLHEMDDLVHRSDGLVSSGHHSQARGVLRQAVALTRRALARCRRARRAQAASPSAPSSRTTATPAAIR